MLHMHRGYRLLFMYCHSCKCLRPFKNIEQWKSVQITVVRKVEGKIICLPSANPIPFVDEDERRIKGVCMLCGKSAMYITTVDDLEDGHYTLEHLCHCGLPLAHQDKHLWDVKREWKRKQLAV